MPVSLAKLQPHGSVYNRGFDRRGCTCSICFAMPDGLTQSVVYSDIFDFAVFVLIDTTDVFGNLYVSKYLPDGDVTAVVLDFDLAIENGNGFYPGSQKFQSVPWGKLSWIKEDGTSGTTPLTITSTTGDVFASVTLTITGTPTTFDRVYIVYAGNYVFDDPFITTGQTLNDVAVYLAGLINAATSINMPLTAVASGADVTITCTQPGQDGNTIELLTMYKTAGNTQITPLGPVKLTGGVDPTSFHVQIDFGALSPLRQAWLTFAPSLPIDSGPTNPTLVTFTPKETRYVFSNWIVTDPSNKTPLKVAGPGSTVVGNKALGWVSYDGPGWTTAVGFYFEGFAKVSTTIGESVTIRYSNQSTHDLYVGVAESPDGGIFDVELDGVAGTPIDLFLDTAPPLLTRRLVQAAVGPGTHILRLTVSGAGTCLFDYLHAVIPSDIVDPAVTYAHNAAAFDFDTGATYQIPPSRSVMLLRAMGLHGDIDFFNGVFFEFDRERYGGTFHACTVTLSGTFGTGTGFGDGDVIWVTVGGTFPNSGTTISGATTQGGNVPGNAIGGTVFGIAVFPADDLGTLAQRAVNAINALFVGIRAEPTGTPGEFIVTVLSPINGFSFDVSLSSGSTGSLAMSGDIGVPVGSTFVGGQEGVWRIAPSGGINRPFRDYLEDVCNVLGASGQTATFALSQELLGPPDVPTPTDAWSQRYDDEIGLPVLTATGFGSWGAGFVEGATGSLIEQTGHGYVTGYRVHLANGSTAGAWAITVLDTDFYDLTTLLSGSHTPASGDAVFAELQTTQCTFNPNTFTPYITNCYIQLATVIDGTGMVPVLQLGEVGYFFFSKRMPNSTPQQGIVGFASFTAPIVIGSVVPHNLLTGQSVLLAGVKGNTASNGWHASITVVDPTHFELDGTSGNGDYVPGTGTFSGGGMPYYDAYISDAASGALLRPLARFWTQQDDPTINAGADTTFLAGLLQTHTDSVSANVKAAVPSTQIEILWPEDVNHEDAYYSDDLPFPQGGRLNLAVNLPDAWKTKIGSSFDFFKVEGLSWWAFYRHRANSFRTLSYPYLVLNWDRADVRVLIPDFNGGTNWQAQYLYTLVQQISGVNFWAVDQFALLSALVQPLPLPKRRAQLLLTS